MSTAVELSFFILDEVLPKGSLPSVIDEDIRDAFRTLKAYSQTYLKEEILDEALERNMAAFSCLLDLARTWLDVFRSFHGKPFLAWLLESGYVSTDGYLIDLGAFAPFAH